MKRKIYAISLLLTFLVVLGHEMIPHHHLGAVVNEHSLVENHHKDHSHKHSHSHQKEKNSYGADFLFSSPLNGHAHSYHTHDFVPLRYNSPQISIDQTPAFEYMSQHQEFVNRALHSGAYKYIDRQPNIIACPLLNSYSLRGPPSLS